MRLLVALFAIAAPSATLAEIQNEQIGFSPNHVFEGTLEGENVDVMTGNVNIHIPIGQYYKLNEWFGYQLNLYYNSKIWDHYCPPGDPPATCEGSFTNSDSHGQGFMLHFGRVWRDGNDNPNVYRYQTPDGADHYFCNGACDGPPTTDSNFTTDLASIRVLGIQDGWIAYPGDGTRVILDHHVAGGPANGGGWYATRIETIAQKPGSEPPEPYEPESDPQHYVDMAYGVGSTSPHEITDSLGRTITLWFTEEGPEPGVGHLDIDLPSFNGQTTTYRLVFDGNLIDDPKDGSDYEAIRRQLMAVEIPGWLDVDESHTFTYDEYGYLRTWTVPTGARMKYYYTHYKSSENHPLHTNMYMKELTIGLGTPEAETYRWTYTRFGDSLITGPEDVVLLALGMQEEHARSNPYQARVLDPFGNLTVYRFHSTAFDSHSCGGWGCEVHWDDGLLYQVDSFAGPAANTARLVRSERYEYDHLDGWFHYREAPEPSNANSIPMRILPAETEIITPGGLTQPQRIERRRTPSWTGFPFRRALQTDEYLNGTLYRSTIVAREPSAEYHDAYRYTVLRDSDGLPISRTDVLFDVNRPLCEVRRASAAMDEPIESCATVTVHPGDVATVNSYDALTGNLSARTIAGGDDASSYGTSYTWVGGTLATKRYDSLSWLAADRTIDLDTGLVVSSRDPAGTETSYVWDGLGRLLSISPRSPEKPVTIVYDTLHATTVRRGFGPDDYSAEQRYAYDDLGRLVREERQNRAGATDVRYTSYDAANRVVRQSEWSDGAVTPAEAAWTEFDYTTFGNPNAGEPGEPDRFVDPLGRQHATTQPDGSTVVTTYDGLATTVTLKDIEGVGGPFDAATLYLRDELGRLIEVDSPGTAADATYEYDGRDNLTRVELWEPEASAPQVRAFVYDALGRLRAAENPENGVVQYLQYDPRGRLLAYRDAANREFQSAYDAAGRTLETSVLSAGGPVTLTSNTYDVRPGGGAGASAGKLVSSRAYRVVDGQSELVATRKFTYGEAHGHVPCVGSQDVGVSAYAGLNGRLLWESVSLQPWDETLQTDYCQTDLGEAYLVKYPKVPGSERTAAEVGYLHENGYLWEVHDLARSLEYISNVEYDPHGAESLIWRGNGLRMSIPRDSQGRPEGFELLAPDLPIRDSLESLFGCGQSGGDPVEIQYCGFPWADGPPPTPPPTLSTLWGTGNYEYDGAGNIHRIGDDLYRYDDVNRLVAGTVVRQHATYGLQYEYDAYGNMLERHKQVVGQSPVVQVFDVDPDTNRLVSQDNGKGVVLDYEYDETGNQIRADGNRQVFDERNRLVEVRDANDELVPSGYPSTTEVSTGITSTEDASGRVVRAAGPATPEWTRSLASHPG